MIACGSHAESGVTTADPLVALERDPQAALAAAKHPTYKATYELTFSSVLMRASASPGLSFSSSQVYTARPPDFRWDFRVTGAKQLQMAVIVRGQDAHICVDDPAPAACYSLPATYPQQLLDSLNMSPLDSMMVATKDMDGTVLPRERIAGVDGACFRWRPRQPASPTPSPNALFGLLGDVKFEACFSADGVMLRTLTGATVLLLVEQRATSISGTVTDADFALPYPLTSAPFPMPVYPMSQQTPRPTPTH